MEDNKDTGSIDENSSFRDNVVYLLKHPYFYTMLLNNQIVSKYYDKMMQANLVAEDDEGKKGEERFNSIKYVDDRPDKGFHEIFDNGTAISELINEHEDELEEGDTLSMKSFFETVQNPDMKEYNKLLKSFIEDLKKAVNIQSGENAVIFIDSIANAFFQVVPDEPEDKQSELYEFSEKVKENMEGGRRRRRRRKSRKARKSRKGRKSRKSRRKGKKSRRKGKKARRRTRRRRRR